MKHSTTWVICEQGIGEYLVDKIDPQAQLLLEQAVNKNVLEYFEKIQEYVESIIWNSFQTNAELEKQLEWIIQEDTWAIVQPTDIEEMRMNTEELSNHFNAEIWQILCKLFPENLEFQHVAPVINGSQALYNLLLNQACFELVDEGKMKLVGRRYNAYRWDTSVWKKPMRYHVPFGKNTSQAQALREALLHRSEILAAKERLRDRTPLLKICKKLEEKWLVEVHSNGNYKIRGMQICPARCEDNINELHWEIHNQWRKYSRQKSLQGHDYLPAFISIVTQIQKDLWLNDAEYNELLKMHWQNLYMRPKRIAVSSKSTQEKSGSHETEVA